MYLYRYRGGLYMGPIRNKSIFASEIFSKTGRYLTFFILFPGSKKSIRRKSWPEGVCTYCTERKGGLVNGQIKEKRQIVMSSDWSANRRQVVAMSDDPV